MKELITELIAGANSLFFAVGGTVALVGLLIVCYWLEVMFDDKQKYDGGVIGFFKWCMDTCKKCLPETTESTEKAVQELDKELGEDTKDDQIKT